MIAKICAANNDIIGAYANISISLAMDEIPMLIQQCKRIPFPTPESYQKT